MTEQAESDSPGANALNQMQGGQKQRPAGVRAVGVHQIQGSRNSKPAGFLQPSTSAKPPLACDDMLSEWRSSLMLLLIGCKKQSILLEPHVGLFLLVNPMAPAVATATAASL